MWPQDSISTSDRSFTSAFCRDVKMTRGSDVGDSVTARKPIAPTKSKRKIQMKVVSQQEAREDDIEWAGEAVRDEVKKVYSPRGLVSYHEERSEWVFYTLFFTRRNLRGCRAVG